MADMPANAQLAGLAIALHRVGWAGQLVFMQAVHDRYSVPTKYPKDRRCVLSMINMQVGDIHRADIVEKLLEFGPRFRIEKIAENVLQGCCCGVGALREVARPAAWQVLGMIQAKRDHFVTRVSQQFAGGHEYGVGSACDVVAVAYLKDSHLSEPG